MESLYFGSSDTYLYGVYHAADPRKGRGEGVVICSPFGQEAVRAHRSLRQLADDLARWGYDVLRFDYRGTGDSAGDMTGVTPADWLEDIECALEELRDLSGASRISLVGLRLSCVLAGAVAARLRVERLALWDPVESGQAYVDEIREAIHSPDPHRESSNFSAPDATIHINGFQLSTGFQAGLAEMSMPDAAELRAAHLLQVVSHESASHERLRQHLMGAPGYSFAHAPAAHDWNYVDHVGGVMFPQPVIQAVVKWFNS